jgi:hypothetical protein
MDYISNMNELKIGLLLDDYNIPAWSYKMIKNIIESDFAVIKLVVLNANPINLQKNNISSKRHNYYGQIISGLFREGLEALYRNLIERHTFLPDANKTVDCNPLLNNFPTIKVRTNRKGKVDYFSHADILKIKGCQIDILVKCGFGVLKGDILKAAKHGVWFCQHSDIAINRGGPPGFWESMQSWPETGSALIILTEDIDNYKVLYKAYSCTEIFSVKDNKSNYYWKTLSFMTRMMEELYTSGEKKFFEKIEDNNKHPMFYSEKLYTKPSNFELSKLILNKIKEKTRYLYEEKFYFNQWILMFHMNNTFSSSLWRYQKIIPPKDRFWADPHIIYKNNKYYIFIEELVYSFKNGHIAVIVMDDDGSYTPPQPIIRQKYHMSYPFVFEHENTFYMIPETSANKTIELWEATEFPFKWEHKMNLMENVEAYDTTLLYHKDKWWLFANMVTYDGASDWDELFLFYAKELFNNDWQPHLLNPIVSDCKSSRPAGKIFKKNGSLYRLSQNCSRRYGYGFNISEIITIDKDHYAEKVVSKVEPNWDKNIIGTHTFNRANKLYMIDALYKRRK